MLLSEFTAITYYFAKIEARPTANANHKWKKQTILELLKAQPIWFSSNVHSFLLRIQRDPM